MKLIIELKDVKALVKYLDKGVSESVMINGTIGKETEKWLKKNGYFSKQIRDDILAISKNEKYVLQLKEEEEEELAKLVRGSI